MPTARELLDQADALMRRNRKHAKGRLGDVPTLTDALDARDSALAPTLILPEEAAAADPIVLEPASSEAPAQDALDPMPLDTLSDLPVLTDVVLGWPAEGQSTPEDVDGHSPELREPGDAGDAFPASREEAQAAAAELPAPAVLEREAPPGGETAQAPHPPPEQPAAATTARVPFLDDDFILEIPAPDETAAAAAAPPPSPVIAASALAADSGDFGALAEEIRMQVLQRLDLFTDTGLREQLGARLAPIVERASAQLIETINRELGELVRGYVAEAIEREIESWRNQNPKSR